MYDQLSFVIGNKTIEVGGQILDLGMLSTEVLNISVDEYRELDALAEAAQQEMDACEGNDDPAVWKKSYERWTELDRRMYAHRVFRLVLIFTNRTHHWKIEPKAYRQISNK